MTRILTASQIDNCVADYLSGMSGHALADKYGITAVSIYRLLKNRGVPRRSLSSAMRKYQCDENFFAGRQNPESSYWAGLLLADGWVTPNINGTLRLSLGLKACDREHLDKFRVALKSNSQIGIYKKNKFEIARISITSNLLCESLQPYGVVERKSLSHPLPNLEPENVRHFLRGYFDGDGCLSRAKRGQWFFQLAGGKDFLEYARSFLKDHVPELGNASVRRHSESGDLHSWTVGGNRQVLALTSFLYHDATIYLERKHRLFLQLCDEANL